MLIGVRNFVLQASKYGNILPVIIHQDPFYFAFFPKLQMYQNELQFK